MPLVGVISDTHGLVRPQALAALAGVDHIIHAGDIGGADVLVALRALAPVTAVRGNNDRQPWADAIRERETITVGAATIHVLHDVKDLQLDPLSSGVHAVIAGHSHRPRIERRHGVLFLNPGRAGPRRFTLPVSIARLHVEEGRLEPEIVELDVASPAAG
jgi:putative phosphoesterase